MDAVSFKLDCEEISGKQIKKIMFSLEESLRIVLPNNYYINEPLFNLEQFDYNRNINDSKCNYKEKLLKIDFFLKDYQNFESYEDEIDYLIYSNKLKFAPPIGDIFFVLTNSIKYINNIRYKKNLNPQLFEKVNPYFRKNEKLGNIILIPNENTNVEYFDKTVREVKEIIQKEYNEIVK